MSFGFPLFWDFVGHEGQADPAGARIMGTIAGVSGVFVTVAAVVPLFVWLRQRGRVTLLHAVSAGVVWGTSRSLSISSILILPFTILHLARGTLSQHLIPLPSLLSSAVRMIVLDPVLGVIGALVFWVVGLAGSSARSQSSTRCSRANERASEQPTRRKRGSWGPRERACREIPRGEASPSGDERFDAPGT